uniref:Glycoside hydrolase family 31 N-terminal domain-containing protein n=1 Tax=Physcomitrium patens TaxID=3218 RepID=A0A2K1IYE2_PHYPA|nr:hypothetical protein PHYPA_024108 [Physcomitrium patens]
MDFLIKCNFLRIGITCVLGSSFLYVVKKLLFGRCVVTRILYKPDEQPPLYQLPELLYCQHSPLPQLEQNIHPTRNEAAPSVSFLNPKVCEEEIKVQSNEPVIYSKFESDGNHQVVTVKFSLGTSFHGTGEVGGLVERTGKQICSWNTDAWGSNQNTTSLYQSHPGVFVVLLIGDAFGVLSNTSRRCELSFAANLCFATTLN